jgi:TPR repeat protein
MLFRKIAFVCSLVVSTMAVSAPPASAQFSPRKLQSEAWEKCLNVDDSNDRYSPGLNCLTAGDLYSDPDVLPDFVRARIAFSKSCEQGSYEGCVKYGEMTAAGEGGDVDFASARRAFDRSCNDPKSGSEGCSRLAEMAAEGQGGAVDLKLAYKAHEAACKDKKTADSCVKSAILAFNGHAPSVLQARGNYDRLLSQITPFCDLDGNRDEPSCYHAGKATMSAYDADPTGVDLEYAYRAFEYACSLMSARAVPTGLKAEACVYQAQFLVAGVGVEQNVEAGATMMMRLCRMKIQKACAALPESLRP